MKKILILLFVSFSSFSQDKSPVKIISLKGNVRYHRLKVISKLSEQTELVSGDIVRTHQDGVIRLQMEDAFVTLGPESYFKIEHVESKNRHFVGELMFGHALMSAREKLADKKMVTLKSPYFDVELEDGEFLYWVTRSSQSYALRLQGDIVKAPRLESLKYIYNGEDFFMQVGVLEGELKTFFPAEISESENEFELVDITNRRDTWRTKALKKGSLLNLKGQSLEVSKLTKSVDEVLEMAKKLKVYKNSLHYIKKERAKKN